MKQFSFEALLESWDCGNRRRSLCERLFQAAGPVTANERQPKLARASAE